jgi:GGDEF domain-containing protein
MVDEFVKSLEGFRDELTGLYSKQTFTKVYEKALIHKEPEETLTVVVFTADDLDGVSEILGHTKAQELIQSLAEYINKHFGDVGLSNRVARDRIVTILPSTNQEAAERLLENFARDLQDQGLIGIQAEIQPADCYSFAILAGLAEEKASTNIEITSEKARSLQKEIARFQCSKIKKP